MHLSPEGHDVSNSCLVAYTSTGAKHQGRIQPRGYVLVHGMTQNVTAGTASAFVAAATIPHKHFFYGDISSSSGAGPYATYTWLGEQQTTDNRQQITRYRPVG